MKRPNPASDLSDRSCVLLIDLDNCPHEILDLAETSQRYDLIIAAHGSREPRVPLGVAAVLGQLVAQGRVEIWAMPPGKNAADFGITFVAGRLSSEMPRHTIFKIASKDRDLDHAVSLLRRSGFQADRIDSSQLPESPEKSQATVSSAASRLASSLCGRGANSRPKRRRTLHAVAKARAPSPEAGMLALTELEDAGAIGFAANNVPRYDDQLLNKYAALAPKKKQKTEPLALPEFAKPKSSRRHSDRIQLELFE
ncbi:PIN domain-containing protein [Allorhodopirellula heiligendammensis]|uniref:PIN-like domain-containing protein n=1 Tax=Allorhodopirellula heiligendammensis TaxID=2714739 RepID=A0A5C6BHB9_9BACT|nr:PIN domain-containing protein [Allorhodopirellula heiligendammensis]TWU10669.1 hypothetical protein Poly21_45750 [Allorhodopirellula heiligendammensis]